MKIRVRLFASARELAGFETRELELPADGTLEDVWRQLESVNPAFERWKESTRFAVNQEYVRGGLRLRDGDEVAVLPPVSGG